MKRISIIGLAIILMLVPIMGVNCDSNGNGVENADATPPIISNVSITDITDTSATISWSTDKRATSNIDYGQSYAGAYNFRAPNPTDYNADNTSHSVNLSGLYKNTTYHFRVSSTDGKNNEAVSEDNTFTTLDTALDTIAPIISAITVSNLTERTATISWTTNELATSNIEYGINTSYGSFAPITADTIADKTSHSLELSGLSFFTTYHYRVKSMDTSGNEATSGDNTFTLLDNIAPVISEISVFDVTESSATITWVTDEPSTSQVQYGITNVYGFVTLLNTTLTRNHSVNLSNLDEGTTYYYRVKSKDGSGNETISVGKLFNTEVKQVYSINCEWDYMWQTWEYTDEIPISIYDYFADKPRTRDYAEYVLNPYDDEWIENLANLFIEQAPEEGWDESYCVPFALSFVQSLPYTSDKVTTGYDEYPRYPIETIVDEGGDCEDTSILFASIVREMGYGVALLLLEDDRHMAVGVLISQSFIDNWDEYYPLTYYITPEGDIYAYCETTAEGWGVGQMPDDLVGTAEIVDVFKAMLKY